MSDNPEAEVPEEPTTMGHYIIELFSNPLNLALLSICAVLLYKIFKDQRDPPAPEPSSPTLSPMKRRDFTYQELKQFDGNSGDGRILIAINGKVFDVTRGKKFYGPGGPYEVFAGQDASRGLATMSLDKSALKEEPDDLSDLSISQLDIVRDWEMQFFNKYDHVGKLLKPGEEPATYEDGKDASKKDE